LTAINLFNTIKELLGLMNNQDDIIEIFSKILQRLSSKAFKLNSKIIQFNGGAYFSACLDVPASDSSWLFLCILL